MDGYTCRWRSEWINALGESIVMDAWGWSCHFHFYRWENYPLSLAVVSVSCVSVLFPSKYHITFNLPWIFNKNKHYEFRCLLVFK